MDKPKNIHKTSYEVRPHIPTKKELEPYKNSDKEPLKWIQELMEGKSKEEMLLAEDNWKRYINFYEKFINQKIEEIKYNIQESRFKEKEIEKEKRKNKEKEILKVVDKNLWKQDKLF